MHATVLYIDGCPNWQHVRDDLTRLTDEFDLAVNTRRVGHVDDAHATGFAGSPTVLLDGADPFEASTVDGLACRVYATEHGPRGAPTVDQLRAALAAASKAYRR